MGRRGPPPKPTKLKVLQGNPGKRKLNKNEPKPRQIPPRMPDYLDDRAKEVWQETLEELERLELVSVVDGPSLAVYCQAVSEIERCDQILQERGFSYTTETGFERPRPEVKIRQDAFQRMIAVAGRFGLTPSDRSRIHHGGPEPTEDEFMEFLSRGRKA